MDIVLVADDHTMVVSVASVPAFVVAAGVVVDTFLSQLVFLFFSLLHVEEYKLYAEQCHVIVFWNSWTAPVPVVVEVVVPDIVVAI